MADPQAQAVMRSLIKVWADFAVDLDTVPLIDKLMRGKFRIDDYRQLLINHRQQVIEGARWIARAASSITSDYADQRAMLLQHALVSESESYKLYYALQNCDA
jgi:3-oxoacyl-[acyl-carrier-protein] synthase III